MNQKAKDYIKSNTLDLESGNRMDSTGYVSYAVSIGKAYGALVTAEEQIRHKAIKLHKKYHCSLCENRRTNGEQCMCEEMRNFIEEMEK